MKLTDQFLLLPCRDFDFVNPPFDPHEFSENLVKFMYENKGLGLAANQVGYNYKIFCMHDENKNFVMFNPFIVYKSEEETLLGEACLSYPGLVVKIKRSNEIRLRFRSPDGKTSTEKFSGMSARVVQHEIMHLEGKPFFASANRYHRDSALRVYKKKRIN